MLLQDVLSSQAKPAEAEAEATCALTEAIKHSWNRTGVKDPPTDEDWFRCSELDKLCPRERALGLAYFESSKEKVSTDTLWTYGLGSAVHWLFQSEILPSLGDVFQGWWKNAANPKMEAFGPELDLPHAFPSLWCPKPPGGEWKFSEMKGRMKEFRLSGHMDGVLCWPNLTPEVLELKTVGEWMVDSVDPTEGGKPLPGHIVQVHGYMMMAELDRARIVYIAKNRLQSVSKALMEHAVNRDEVIVESIKKTIRTTIEALQSVSEKRKEVGVEGALPDEVIGVICFPDRLKACMKKTDSRAKNCHMRNQCFQNNASAKA